MWTTRGRPPSTAAPVTLASGGCQLVKSSHVWYDDVWCYWLLRGDSNLLRHVVIKAAKISTKESVVALFFIWKHAVSGWLLKPLEDDYHVEIRQHGGFPPPWLCKSRYLVIILSALPREQTALLTFGNATCALRFGWWGFGFAAFFLRNASLSKHVNTEKMLANYAGLAIHFTLVVISRLKNRYNMI